MTLEDPQLLREKNAKRLRDVYNSNFLLGINVTAPSPFKDMLRIITFILLTSCWADIWAQCCYILRYKNNIVIIADSICTMLQTLISIGKLSYIVVVQRKFYAILKLVSTHELIDKIELLSQETSYNCKLRKQAQMIVDDCWLIAKRQFNFYIVACILIISYYFFNSQVLNAYNYWYIGNDNHTIITPFPALYPLWENKMTKFPHYAIVTFVGASACLLSGIGATSFDGIFIIIAQHGVALIRILRVMIAFTTSSDVPRRLHVNYLRQCIYHQERTFQYCSEFNKLYFHISVLQFLLSLVILGVVMFQASVGLENNIGIVIKMAMYMTAAGFQVVLYCLNGQLITNESDALSFAWYETKWYDESKEFMQLVQMMIMRSNPIFYMNVSWFSTMSLTTLMDLLKTSGSYFVLLRNLSVEVD